jgi:hypothetical protein
MRGELERLRADLQESGRKNHRPAAAAANGQCGLPAGVPELPAGLRVSAEMRELATTLLSPAGTRVGFVGMGGIGESRCSPGPPPPGGVGGGAGGGRGGARPRPPPPPPP